jgi:hypothetical protein
MSKMYFYLYKIHLTTLPPAQTAYGQLIVVNKQEMDVEGNGLSPFQDTNSALVSKSLDGNHDKPRDSWYPSRNSNWAPPEYKSRYYSSDLSVKMYIIIIIIIIAYLCIPSSETLLIRKEMLIAD